MTATSSPQRAQETARMFVARAARLSEATRIRELEQRDAETRREAFDAAIAAIAERMNAYRRVGQEDTAHEAEQCIAAVRTAAIRAAASPEQQEERG